MKIKLICDGVSNITPELVEKFKLSFLPIYIVINNQEEYLESDLNINDFLSRLINDESIEVVKTSQCNVNDFHALYQQCINDYDIILHLAGSSTASGTYQSSMIAKSMIENNEKIIVFDTQTIAIGGTLLADKAVELINENKPIDEILTILEDYKERLQVYFTVETLDYLKKCGRVSFPKAALANMLNLKPLMHLADGKPYLNKQIRGKKQLFNYLVDKIKEEYDGGKVYIVYCISDENALKLKTALSAFIPEENIEMTIVSCGIAVQVGPDGYGVGYIKKG